MISLVFDTETTGPCSKPDPQDPATDAVVQLFAALYEHDENVIEEVDGVNSTGDKVEQFIVKPKPFAIFSTLIDPERAVDPKAQQIHGISRERAEKLGIDGKNAAHVFEDFVDIADVLVAHNKKFDLGICGRLLHTAGLDASILREKDTFDTMLALKPVMRLTPKVYGDWKNPKLIEAYRYVFNRDFAGQAHDAAADTLACADLYFACIHMGIKDPTA